MAAIEIPDDYWIIDPAGFSALVQSFEPAFADVYAGLGSATNGLTTADGGDTGVTLGALDGDADVIGTTLGDEALTTAATPTDGVLARYGGGDGLSSAADTGVAAVNASDPGGGPYTPTTPPEFPPEAGDGGDPGGGGEPGGGTNPPEPPDPQPPEPPNPEPPTTPEPEPPPEPPAPPEPLPSYPTVDPGGGSLPGGGGGIDPDPGIEDENSTLRTTATPPPPPTYVTYDDLAAVISALDLTINVQV